MKLVIQGDKIAAMVGDDFPTTDMLVDVPEGFDINQAHRFRYNVADGQIVVRVPARVTAFQAKMALADAGRLGAVETLMADPATPQRTRMAWLTAAGFERQSDMITSMAALLELTEAQLDALFIAAAQIN
jgi:hypothetical protein